MHRTLANALPPAIPRRALLTLVAVSLAGAGIASAATFTVDSTASAPDAVLGDGICDDGTGVCTLTAAVGEAASFPTCQEPVAVHFSLSGQIDADISYEFAPGSACTNPSLSIVGPGADSLVLNGNVSASGYVAPVPAECIPYCQIDTVIGLQGLHVSGDLHFDAAAASLTDVIANGPIASRTASLTITGSSVDSVSNYGDGPIPRPYGDVTVVNSTTRRISSFNTLWVSIVGVRVSGGLSVTGTPGYLAGANVWGSIIEDSPGCGVSVAGVVSLAGTTIRNNGGCGAAAYYGGTVFPSISIADSTISGNGGVGVGTEHGGQMSIIRSSIARNRGGGVGTSPPGASISISDSIIAGNSDAGGESLDCAGEASPGSTTATRSIIGSTGGCSITPDGNLIGVDPLLGPLADNGGLTPTHALLPGSPAIDAAGACTGTDQRGVARPQGAACDIGAFEFACGNGTVDLGEQCDDGSPGDGDCCSANCSFEAGGNTCVDDGEPCTADVCDGAGVCAHAFPGAAGCHEATPRGSSLVMTDSVTDRSDRLSWKWKGQAQLADLGNPAADTDLTLCVADATGRLVVSADLPAAGSCGGRNCWRSAKVGYQFVDPAASNDGIRSATLKASPRGSGRIKVKGQGEALPLGTLSLALPATVRLLRSDASACWESKVTTSSRNDANAFRGR